MGRGYFWSREANGRLAAVVFEGHEQLKFQCMEKKYGKGMEDETHKQQTTL